MQDKHGLLSAPISKVLRNMTVPMVFGMVAILAFNLVDTFFISLLGTEALAAISFTFPVTFGVNCITMGIGMGLSTNIGRLLGQGNTQHAARFSTHGLLLAVVLVMLASTLGLYTILFSSAALAENGGGFMNMTGGQMAALGLGIAAIVGIAAVVTNDNDDGVS